MSDPVTTLSGPVASVDGRLMLRIPLEQGGRQLVAASKGIGVVVGDQLEVTIPGSLAAKLGIADGTVVDVDNRNGRCNIHPRPSVE